MTLLEKGCFPENDNARSLRERQNRSQSPSLSRGSNSSSCFPAHLKNAGASILSTVLHNSRFEVHFQLLPMSHWPQPVTWLGLESRWEVKGPCWHGGIGKGEEEIHSDGFSPQGQVTKVTMGQMEAGPHLSSGNLDLFSTDGHESPTYLSGLLRR